MTTSLNLSINSKSKLKKAIMNTSNSKKIQHLYWRAGFGLSPNELVQKSKISTHQLATQLVNDAKKASKLPNVATPFATKEERKNMSREERKKMSMKLRQLVGDVNEIWVKEMAETDNPLLERMSLFWHDHFACRIKNANLVPAYMNAIRQNAVGDFKSLLMGVSKSAAMIRYLNNQQNRKEKPNENFAREVMELFTIGRGNYTEKDIKEAARAFTGWSSNLQGAFVFRKHWHDAGSKTFMGKTGNFGGEDIIDIILERKETAQYLVTKIYKYFVNQKVDQRIIKILANDFYKNNYDIGKLMLAIFQSSWFYNAEHIGTKIKSPIDMLVGTMRIFDIEFKGKQAIIFTQKALGQVLFDPPNVAGWSDGKAWIDNATLMLRLNFASYLFQAMEMNIAEKTDLKAKARNRGTRKLVETINAKKLIKTFKPYEGQVLFNNMKAYLLVPNVNIDKSFVDKYTINENKEDYIRSLSIRLMSLPEYQMC